MKDNAYYEHQRHLSTMKELYKVKKILKNLLHKHRKIMYYLKFKEIHYQDATKVQSTNRRRIILRFITKLNNRLNIYEQETGKEFKEKK